MTQFLWSLTWITSCENGFSASKWDDFLKNVMFDVIIGDMRF